MATMFYNHLGITGPQDTITKYAEWCHVNVDMIDMDDGASDVERYDHATNYERHKHFIDFIRDETGTRVDRVRLFKIDGGGLLICLDSWHCFFGTHTHWMASNFPELKFNLNFMQDSHICEELTFEQGKWISLCHETECLAEGSSTPTVAAVGYIDDYRDDKVFGSCNVADLDDELRAFAARYVPDGMGIGDLGGVDGISFTALYKESGDATWIAEGLEGLSGLKLIADCMYGSCNDDHQIDPECFGDARLSATEVRLVLDEAKARGVSFIVCYRIQDDALGHILLSDDMSTSNALTELIHFIRCGLVIERDQS